MATSSDDIQLRLAQTWLHRALSRQTSGTLWSKIKFWHERARQRRALLAMDAFQLKDIGVTSADAYREGIKPFWRG